MTLRSLKQLLLSATCLLFEKFGDNKQVLVAYSAFIESV